MDCNEIKEKLRENRANWIALRERIGLLKQYFYFARNLGGVRGLNDNFNRGPRATNGQEPLTRRTP